MERRCNFSLVAQLTLRGDAASGTYAITGPVVMRADRCENVGGVSAIQKFLGQIRNRRSMERAREFISV
jgi:hypothetical protein